MSCEESNSTHAPIHRRGTPGPGKNIDTNDARATAVPEALRGPSVSDGKQIVIGIIAVDSVCLLHTSATQTTRIDTQSYRHTVMHACTRATQTCLPAWKANSQPNNGVSARTKSTSASTILARYRCNQFFPRQHHRAAAVVMPLSIHVIGGFVASTFVIVISVVFVPRTNYSDRDN